MCSCNFMQSFKGSSGKPKRLQRKFLHPWPSGHRAPVGTGGTHAIEFHKFGTKLPAILTSLLPLHHSHICDHTGLPHSWNKRANPRCSMLAPHFQPLSMGSALASCLGCFVAHCCTIVCQKVCCGCGLQPCSTTSPK